MARLSRRRPSLELLEERVAPAVFGLPWPDPGQLTISMVPDGTNVGGVPSVLSQTLGATLSRSAWEYDILLAFQTWADDANINLGLVADDGAPVGQSGMLQGNPGYGDIRVAAVPLSSEVQAISDTFDPLNDWAGTVMLNSNVTFGNGGSGGTGQYDLFSIALHEAGHVLGLPDNADPTSAMYYQYNGVLTGPSAADIAALQAIYGARSFNTGGNSTFGTAAPLTFAASAAAEAVTGDVGAIGGTDVYEVQVPGGASRFTVDLKAEGISLLTPSVTVCNAAGQVVASGRSTDPTNNNVTLNVPGNSAGGTYYVEVTGSQSNAFGIGSFRLAVGTTNGAQAAVASTTAAAVPPNGHASGSIGTAYALSPSTAAGWTYTVQSTLTNPSTGDYYEIQTGAQAPGTMLVTVWATGGGALGPKVAVFNAQDNPVPAQVVAQDAHSETLQIEGVASQATYYVQVAPANPANFSSNQGSYFLGIDLTPTPLPFQTLATGTLQQSSNQGLWVLNVPVDQVLHLDLSASTGTVTIPTTVRLTITNTNGNALFSITAQPGDDGRGDVLLTAGTYYVRLVAGTLGGAALPPVAYTVSGFGRTDTIGVDIDDPTQLPPDPTTTTAPDSTTTDTPPPDPTTTTTAPDSTTTDTPPPDPTTTTTASDSTTTTTMAPAPTIDETLYFDLPDPYGDPWPS